MSSFLSNKTSRSVFLQGEKIRSLPEFARKDIEAYIVNSVKIKMLKKWDPFLKVNGRLNLRKLFLVPIFQITDMEKRIIEIAPEMKIAFYKELAEVVNSIENKLF